MPTLVDYFEATTQASALRLTNAETALETARTVRDQATQDHAAASAAHAAAVAALATAGAGIGEHGTWPDADALGGTLRTALIAERAASTEVREKSYRLSIAESAVERHEGLVASARAENLEHERQLEAARADHAEVEQWRALANSAPFDDPVAFANSVRNSDGYVAARAWLGDQIPDALIDRGLARGSEALEVTERATRVADAYADAFDSVVGAPAPERRSFDRRRAAIADYVRQSEERIATATSIVAEIPNGKGVSAAQHAEITDPATLADRVTSLNLLSQLATRQGDIHEFDALFERFRAITLADPSTADGDVDSEARASTETAMGTTRADLVTAFDAAEGAIDAEDIDRVLEWETAVPDDVWRRLAWFHQASADLNTISGVGDQLFADYDAAENALVAALEAADASVEITDRMSAPAAAAVAEFMAISSTETIRRVGLVRGEEDDDRS